MSLSGRLLLAIGYILLVAIVAFVVPLAINTSGRIDSEVRAQAAAQADLLAVAAAEEFDEGPGHVRPLADVAAETVRGRVIVVDERGRLIADSESEPRGTDFSTRPEVVTALEGRRVQQERESTDLGVELIATAAPIIIGDEVVGAVRVTQSTESEQRAVLDSIWGLIGVGLIVLAIGLIAALVVARSLATPLREMTASAERIAAGDLDERVPPTGSTEQRALARAFNAMTERLSAALRSQRRFVADASHQLRTPLTGVRLRLEEALAELPAGPGSKAASAEIDAATAEVDRLAEIVNEMLALSRVGERRAEPEPVLPSVLAEEAVARWGADARQKEIAIRVEGSAPEPVICPPGDAAQVLDVLVENAIRYAPGGSQIRIAVEPGRLRVIDQGPGISVDELEEVFERFHRGSAGRAGSRGTGLGLPIARGLSRAWGGEVTLGRGGAGGTVATLDFSADRPAPIDGIG